MSADLTRRYRTGSLLAAKTLMGGIASLLAALVWRGKDPTGSTIAQLVLLGVVAIACSSSLFFGALKRIGAGRTSAMNIALTALVGAAGGAWLLHERLGWFHAGALAAVLAGSAMLALPRGIQASV